MKSNLFLTIITVFVLLLSACSTKAVPTVDPALVQASAVAAASTMLAMTQDAMPTATPIPPTVAATDTPQPTPTIPLLPTNPVLPHQQRSRLRVRAENVADRLKPAREKILPPS